MAFVWGLPTYMRWCCAQIHDEAFCWDLVAAPRSSNQNNYWHNVISILLSIQLESNRILLRWSPFKRSSRGRLWLMDECHQKQQHKFIREIQWGFPTQVRILPAAPCLLHANCLLVSTATARWRDPLADRSCWRFTYRVVPVVQKDWKSTLRGEI